MSLEKSEKKSLIITALITAGMIVVLLLCGFTYLDPPLENGIAVNFGTSSVGSGYEQPKKPVKITPTETTPPEPAKPEPKSSSEQQQDEVITQETGDVPVISKETTVKKNNNEDKVVKKETEVTQKTEKVDKETETTEKPVKKPDPKPDKSTKQTLNSLLNGEKQDGKASHGEGNDNQAGDKGDPNGSLNANSYYGQGQGLSGSGNYRLSGRKALTKTKYQQQCNEEGVVVVKIQVNQQGKVVKAIPGVKGTTNASDCLLNPAKRAALDTRFNSDSNAPYVQTGYIIYEFKLSD